MKFNQKLHLKFIFLTFYVVKKEISFQSERIVSPSATSKMDSTLIGNSTDLTILNDHALAPYDSLQSTQFPVVNLADQLKSRLFLGRWKQQKVTHAESGDRLRHFWKFPILLKILLVLSIKLLESARLESERFLDDKSKLIILNSIPKYTPGIALIRRPFSLSFKEMDYLRRSAIFTSCLYLVSAIVLAVYNTKVHDQITVIEYFKYSGESFGLIRRVKTRQFDKELLG